jgi:hypothetical protein
MEDTVTNAGPRILREMIFDVFPETVTHESVVEIQQSLGLVPVSSDGEAVERAQSTARLENLRPLSEPLSGMSVLAARAFSEYVIARSNVEGDDRDTLRSVMVNQNALVVCASVHTIIAHLIETGVLEYGAKFK